MINEGYLKFYNIYNDDYIKEELKKLSDKKN